MCVVFVALLHYYCRFFYAVVPQSVENIKIDYWRNTSSFGFFPFRFEVLQRTWEKNETDFFDVGIEQHWITSYQQLNSNRMLKSRTKKLRKNVSTTFEFKKLNFFFRCFVSKRNEKAKKNCIFIEQIDLYGFSSDLKTIYR